MTLREYFWQHLKTPEERAAYAARAGTTLQQLERCLVRKRGGPPTRVPLHVRILRLSIASEGHVSETAALAHFASTARLMARLSMAADGYEEAA